jgi:hypothetical protein
MHQRSNEVDVPRSVAQNPRRAQKRPGGSGEGVFERYNLPDKIERYPF